MIQLRAYQESAVSSIRQAFREGKRAPLLVLPTGGGKTVVFSFVSHNAVEKGNRVLILAHRAELIDQIAGALEQFGIQCDYLAAGYPRSPAAVTVASVQMLVRRLKTIAPPDLIVVDEAHHCVKGNSWGLILAAFPNARVLGVTATARRPSGEALGDMFDCMVIGPTVQELTDQGFLAPARIFAPPTVDTKSLHIRAGEFVQSEVKKVMGKPSVTGDAIAHYRKLADGKKAVCFCYSVEHSMAMAEAFRAAGYSAIHLDGGIERELRREIVKDFRDGKITIVCSVDILGEGFDLPGIEVGILLRPTASEIVYLQQLGRCLRAAPGKDHALILDHCGNTLRHGLPTDERNWTLTGKTKRARDPNAPKFFVRICSTCFAAQASGPPRCKFCGHVFPIDARQVAHVAGDLVELQQAREKREARVEQGRARSLDDLRALGRSLGRKPGWAEHVYQARQAKGRR